MRMNNLNSIRHDWNKELNSLRAQINKEVREKCFEALERAREIRGGTEKLGISGVSQKQVFGGDD